MTQPTNRLKDWITIGGTPDGGKLHRGGTPVFVDESGNISRGPAALTGKPLSEVDQDKRKPGEKPKPPSPKKPADRLTQPDKPLADRPPEHEPTPPAIGETPPSQEEPADAEPTGQPERESGSTAGPGEAGEAVAPAAEGAGGETAAEGRQDEAKPASGEAAGDVPRPRERVAADLGHVNKRIDRYEQLFRKNGQEKQAKWMGLLKAHVNQVGTEEALASLGAEQAVANRERVVYEGEKAGWESMDDFTHAYLNRHGIVPVHSTGETADISSLSKKFSAGEAEDGYTTGDLFTPLDPELPNKLEEAKHLPGLESSEDINVVMGRDVTHLTDDVTAKMDEKYGKGQWIIKVYGDDAYAGFGIFFPQRVAALKKEAQEAVWSSGAELAKYGFSHLRDEAGSITGIQHQSGDKYEFGSREYQTQIYGDVRAAADRAEAAAKNEKGPALLDRNGNVSGKEFMVQPAFAAVGISDEERARGVTGAEGGKGEGRVHIVTRNGKAELVPHSTWVKGQWLPVVFESEETRQMAQAAVDAINALPESERQGQIYAPDVMHSEQGYRVIEANPANNTGSSGYLGDNPFIIDSYVSHILGQEPLHTKFIRDLLSKKRGGGKKGGPVVVTKGGVVNRLVSKQPAVSSRSPVAAGLAVVASDTGRVLMIQRPLDGGDPNGGKWEFPGGRIESDEKPFAAAWREWLEETGLLMRGGLDASIAIDAYGNQWDSEDGKYRGYVAWVPSEDILDFSKRDLFSDPDSEVGNVIAWVHPRDLPQHNLRPALLSDIDEVMARVTKWLLDQVQKLSPVNRLVTKAACEQGQTAANTHCTPADGRAAGALADSGNKVDENQPYNEHKGMNAAANAKLVAQYKVKVKVPEKQREAANRALSHVLSNKLLAEEMLGMLVSLEDTGRLHGRVGGGGLQISLADLEKEGPGFTAAIIRHELEHRILSKKGVSTGQQEARVQYTAGMWAALKYSILAKDGHKDAEGFKKAAILQGVKVKGASSSTQVWKECVLPVNHLRIKKETKEGGTCDWDDDDVVSVPPAREKRASFFETCDRDEEGHCIAGTGGAASRAGQAAGRAMHTAGEIEHKIKEVVGRNFEKLPEPVQKAVTAILKVAFAAFTAGQAMAERVAKEHGLTDAQAAALRGTLATVDLVAFKAAKGAAFSGVPGAGLATLVSGIVPVASVGYLLYSTGQDRQATWRAAKGLAKDAVAAVKARLAKKPTTAQERPGYKPSLEQIGRSYTKGQGESWKTVATERDAGLLTDALAKHNFDDWYLACLTAALEDAGGNVAVAVAAADEMYRQKPAAGEVEQKGCCVIPTNRLRMKSPDRILQTMTQIGHGADKFTKLSDLGRHLGDSPESLHAAVMQLWRSGKITVAAAEGRHGSTPEERHWWLNAQGEVFGYVMLRN